MKGTLYRLLAYAAVAAFMGVAAADVEGGQWVLALAYAAVTFVSLWFFVSFLPKRIGLPTQILVALIAGVFAGWAFKAADASAFVIDYLNILGTLFVLLLKLVIIPLIFVSIVTGVAGIGDPRKLGSVGFKALAFYFCTTSIAVLVGLFVVNTIQPGRRIAGVQEAVDAIEERAAGEEAVADPNVGRRIQEDVLPTVIQNPIMAGQNPLVIIFFAILLGAALASLGEVAEPALAVFRGLDKAFITLVLWVMFLAPIGVFTLMSKAIAELGVDYVQSLALYVVTVISGLGLHFVILVTVVLALLARVSPARYLRGIGPALGLSFSTSSSAATLPVTIDCTTRRVGADKNVANFMLPIGATVNMDGTALYQAVAVIFISQVLQLELTLAQQVGVFITAILVSIGTAGIPGGSIALMPIVLSQAGIEAEYVGIVIGVDRILDMSRTLVNITGDSVGAVVVSRSEGVLGEPEDPLPPV